MNNVLQNVFLVVFGLSLILVGFVVFLQSNELSELSGRLSSVAQSLNASSEQLDHAMMRLDEMKREMDEQAEMMEQAMMAADCTTLGPGWARYESNTVNMSFCVNNSWGQIREELVNYSPEAAEGNSYRIAFTREGEAAPGPIISYSSQDFRKLLDSDVPSLDWSIVDFSKTDEELERDFAEFEGVTPAEDEFIDVTKTTIDGLSALKVEADATSPLSGEPVHYYHWYIPESVADGSYNVQIYSDASLASQVQLLIDSMEMN